MENQPIGIIDSGLGGLTVTKEIRKALPYESILYIGDSLNTPYGEKTDKEIYALSVRLIQFLLSKKVKLIVIACNTITVSCLTRLRKEYPEIPIVGIVPVVKKAVNVTTNQKIGILSTTRTSRSKTQKELIKKYASKDTVINKGTDRIVPLLENGLWRSKKMTIILRQVLRTFIISHVDSLVLGCTHYPFIASEIQKIVGKNVRILDSGGAIGRQVKRILTANNLQVGHKNPVYRFYTTGSQRTMQYMVERLGFLEKNSVKTITL